MLRTLSIHLIAMAVLIGSSAYVLWAVWPGMPPMTRGVCIGLAVVFVLAWIALLALRLAPGGDAARWRRHDQAIMWLGNAVTVVAFWLEMPYADDALRLLVVIFLFGPITVEVLGSIQRPPARAGWVLTPLVLPVSTAFYFVVHWGRYSLPVLLFSLANAYVFMSLRRVVQRAVDRAYAARLTAEAALVQVAAERDAKTRFLASASHDLGQPLQAARLFFDQVMRSPDAPRREAAAQRVTWAFDSMAQLLRQMLDHLRLESGSVEAHLGPVAVGPLLARIAEMNEPAARLAGMAVLAVPSRLTAVADVSLTERVLGNLVGNAIRHAKGSRVLVGARRRAGQVRLWVIDDGAGIAEADADRLFDDYVQGSDHGDEIRGGFGLGLASARRMAGLMDGAIGLDLNWRKGSAFWLELNAAETKTP